MNEPGTASRMLTKSAEVVSVLKWILGIATAMFGGLAVLFIAWLVNVTVSNAAEIRLIKAELQTVEAALAAQSKLSMVDSQKIDLRLERIEQKLADAHDLLRELQNSRSKENTKQQ